MAIAHRSHRVDLSTRVAMKSQDWSGRGRITKIDKTSGPVIRPAPKMSWTIVYGRSLAASPKAHIRQTR
jgi:hypothetical protein